MTERLQILYVGSLTDGGSTCFQRLTCLRELGHDVIEVNTYKTGSAGELEELWSRIRWRLRRPTDPAGANHAVVAECKRRGFDIIWIDKGVTIRPSTLANIRCLQPHAMLVGFSLDDMAVPHNQSNYFLVGLGYYDLYVTTKSYNVDELTMLGARRVLFVNNSFDRNTHKPMELTDADKKRFSCEVGFIGSYEEARSKSIRFLADSGVVTRVLGNDWPTRTTSATVAAAGPSVAGVDYAKAISATNVNLCFLRRCNRDLQTTRSVEIPACGAFMLAERTKEHMELFTEGKEVEFFDDDEEMLRKVRYYLTHAEDRARIAAAGRRRCIDSGYSYHDRLQVILQSISRIEMKTNAHQRCEC